MTNPVGGGQQPPQLVIKVPEDVEAGVFAHAAMITSTSDSFVLDFLTLLPGTQPPVGKVVSRVFIPPAQAAEILKALSNQLSQHETQFGQIKPYPGGGLTGPSSDS